VAEAAHPPTYRDVHERTAIIHPTAVVSDHAIVGAPGEWRAEPSRYPAVVDAGVVVREFATVHAGCRRQTHVGEGTLVMTKAHVGHDARIGTNCNIAAGAVVGGHVTIGNDCKLGINAVIREFVTIGDRVIIGAGAVVTKDIPTGETWAGVPAKRINAWDKAHRDAMSAYLEGDVSV